MDWGFVEGVESTRFGADFAESLRPSWRTQKPHSRYCVRLLQLLDTEPLYYEAFCAAASRCVCFSTAESALTL